MAVVEAFDVLLARVAFPEDAALAVLLFAADFVLLAVAPAFALVVFAAGLDLLGTSLGRPFESASITMAGADFAAAAFVAAAFVAEAFAGVVFDEAALG